MPETIQEMLIRHEGIRLFPYFCPADKLSIGVGRNLDDNGITEHEAMYLLQNDINRTVAELHSRYYWFLHQTGHRQDCLVDMCFNLGITRFSKFKKTIKAIEAGDYEKAADEMVDSKWASQVGNRAIELSEIMRQG